MNNTKNLMKIFIPFIVIIFTVACSKESVPTKAIELSTTNKIEKSTYENDEYGIKISYPKDWSTQNLAGTLVAFMSPIESTSDKFSENVNIVIQDLSAQPMDIKTFFESTKLQIQQYITNPDILLTEKTKLINEDAYKIVYTGEQGLFKLKWMQLFTIKNNKAYAPTFTAEESQYDKFEKTASETFNSFILNK